MDTGVWYNQLSSWLDAFGPAVFDYLWFAGGAIGLLLWFWLANRVFRWALGYRKYAGHCWLNAAEYRTLIERWDDDVQTVGDPGTRQSAAVRSHRRDHVPCAGLPPANRHFG